MKTHLRRMAATAALCAFGVLALASAAPTASAQDALPDLARVEQAILQTDQVIERAGEVVSASDDAQAHAALDAAVEFQAQAKEAFVGGRVAISLRLTLKARDHARRAVALARGVTDAVKDRVEAALERTDALIDRVTDVVRESGSARAEAQLQAAIRLQGRAQDLFFQGRLRAALRSTFEAREHAMRAARLAHQADRLEGRVDHALETTDALIERAEPVVMGSGNERAEARFRAGLRLQTQAKAAFAQGKERQAVRLTLQAREQVFASLRLVESA